MSLKIFLNEGLFSKGMIPNYAEFFKKEDPELYQFIIEDLESGGDYQREITDQDFNVEIENYLYNTSYNNHFSEEVNEKLVNYAKELVELKNPHHNVNISTRKRPRRKRIRSNRI